MAVVPDAARLVRIAATGVGLSDAGMGAVVQHFADATARNAMSPTPQVNTLTMLATAPGEVDFWDGTKWLPIADRVNTQPGGTEFLRLSGPYNGITPMTRVMSTVTKTADGAGQFTILDATATGGQGGGVLGRVPADRDPADRRGPEHVSRDRGRQGVQPDRRVTGCRSDHQRLVHRLRLLVRPNHLEVFRVQIER